MILRQLTHYSKNRLLAISYMKMESKCMKNVNERRKDSEPVEENNIFVKFKPHITNGE